MLPRESLYWLMNPTNLRNENNFRAALDKTS